MFTLLLFNTVRYLNYSSLPYWLFNFDPKYIIQRDSLLFFFKNFTITIITIYGQVVKMHFFFCINNLYWRLCNISLRRFISTAIFCVNNSTVFRLCLFLNCSIIINFSSFTFLSCLFSAITVVRFLLILFSTSLVSLTVPYYSPV